MERVAQLLDPSCTEHSLQQALVCLWVLARDRLNTWEQGENEATIEKDRVAFDEDLQAERKIPQTRIEQAPLALIRALDDFLAAMRTPHAVLHAGHEEALHHEGGTAYWLVPVTQNARRQARTVRQTGYLSRWFHHHAVLPQRTAYGIQVRMQTSRSALDTGFRSLLADGVPQLKVWVAHFDDEADVVGDQQMSAIGNWRALCVQPDSVRTMSIQRTLDDARAAGAQVVVFPEFTIDVAQRQVVIDVLRADPTGPCLVVAGSFHEPVSPPASMPAFNTAPVYAQGGRHLFSQRKLRLFGDRDSGAEYVDVGRQIEVLLTPVGCMTVLICRDFIDEDVAVRSLLNEVPVDWVWVPSFGNEATLRAHKRRAYTLATVTPGTSVAVAQTKNSAAEPHGRALPGFAHAGGQKDPVDVPAQGCCVGLPLGQQPTLRVVK